MASVQWGATSGFSVLVFNAGAALRNLPNGAGSVAILWKPQNNPADGVVLQDSTDSDWYHGLGLDPSAFWFDDDGIAGAGSAAAVTSVNHWFIAATDWPSGGASNQRFHHIDLTSAGSWVHQNSAGLNGGNRAGPSPAGHWRIGFYNDSPGGEPSGMQIALVAAWAGVRLGDTNAALLSTNKKTSDWYSNPVGTPTFLSEITSLTPTDLTGGSSFAGGSVTTGLTVGGNPDGGWTFDGVGTTPAPPPELVMAPSRR